MLDDTVTFTTKCIESVILKGAKFKFSIRLFGNKNSFVLHANEKLQKKLLNKRKVLIVILLKLFKSVYIRVCVCVCAGQSFFAKYR